MRIAIIGGGISGLSAAWELLKARQRGIPLDVRLFEAGPRLGGVIQTEIVDDCVIEAGPDSWLSEKREVRDLAAEMGLAGDLIGSNDASRRTWILYRGKLEPLPDGLQFLVPARPMAVFRSRLLDLGSKLKIAADLFRMPRPEARTADESVTAFVARHFGRALADNIAAPLLSGVYGGDSSQLSAQATLPRFVEMERRYGSLVRPVLEARLSRSQPGSSGAIFTTLRTGLSRLVQALVEKLCRGLGPAGLRVDTPVETIRHGSAWELSQAQGEGPGIELGEFDAVILALPAYRAAALLQTLDAGLAAPLAGIPYSSSAIVALGYPGEVRRRLPAGFGVLVPRSEHRRMLACTFMHAKFDHRVAPDRALVRCFLSGAGDEEPDAALIEMARAEMRSVLSLGEAPLFTRAWRWPRAMPQYTVGHAERLHVFRAGLAQHPGLAAAGNWLSGIGLSDCVRSGREAAAACLKDIR